ncbi:unnamed protein product, partial [Choristocarpus tenellus]
MIILSTKVKNRFDRSTNFSVDNLLSIYSLHRKSKTFHARWLPISDLREMMEFKIVHNFFQTTFDLPYNFDFALYMREANDRFILSLVDVEATTWLVLIIVCFLNLARVEVWKVLWVRYNGAGKRNQGAAGESCEESYTLGWGKGKSEYRYDDHGDEDGSKGHRMLGSSGGDTTGSDGMVAFMISGWTLLALAVVHYFISRRSELNLLCKAGCKSTLEYHERLGVMEKGTLQTKHKEMNKTAGHGASNDLARLKMQVEQARERKSRNHGRHHGH